MTSIQPLGSIILVEKIEETEMKTASGLVLTATAMEQELSRGTVIKLGDGIRDSQGNIHPFNIQVGDVVYFNDMHLTDVTDSDAKKYGFLAYSNIYGKVSNA
jgi:co-chaperonin GroES (HSP10)